MKVSLYPKTPLHLQICHVDTQIPRAISDNTAIGHHLDDMSANTSHSKEQYYSEYAPTIGCIIPPEQNWDIQSQYVTWQ